MQILFGLVNIKTKPIILIVPNAIPSQFRPIALRPRESLSAQPAQLPKDPRPSGPRPYLAWEKRACSCQSFSFCGSVGRPSYSQQTAKFEGEAGPLRGRGQGGLVIESPLPIPSC